MVEQSTNDWKKDSQSFDTVASLYDQCRPGYPQELVDGLISMINLPKGSKILEIGSGTGKATILFARLGYAIHCIEPGVHLATLAANNLQGYPAITFEIARFEESHEYISEFELVISAQAFHWIRKDVGYAKIAQALKSGGSLAFFWNMHPDLDGQINIDLDRIYRENAPELVTMRSSIENVVEERSHEIAQSGLFGPVTIQRFPWSITYHTRQYLGLLNTYSDHLRLSGTTRQRLFEAVAAAIIINGGYIKREYVTVEFIAQKLS